MVGVEIADSEQQAATPSLSRFRPAPSPIRRQPLTLSAGLASGQPPPGWLQFNGTAFTGTAPGSQTPIVIDLTASDGLLTATQSFALNIIAVNAAPGRHADRHGDDAGLR